MKGVSAIAGVLMLSAGAVLADCRLALVLALDVSGSVDPAEYRLQLDGIAKALQDTDVVAAILANPARTVSMSVLEWSSRQYQREILPWTSLQGRADIDAVSTHLNRWQRVPAPEATGLGAALRKGAVSVEQGPDCERRVIDVSGDGKNNDWPDPDLVRREGTLNGITVNALVVLSPGLSRLDAEGLVTYFEERVLHGPGAFAEVANGYADYARAMERKLLREVSAPRVGRGPQTTPPNRGANAPRSVDVADLIAPETFEFLQ